MQMTQKISGLPNAGPITGDEFLEIVQDGENKKALASAFGGGGSIPDAPVDGKTYGRENSAWVEIDLDAKVDKVTGKGLSTEDYTTVEKIKLEGVESGAQVNAVTSVAGKDGEVSLVPSDISGLGNSATRDVGTDAGTVAAGDDQRLSDEREWTASVVTQAEAEAGTSSTARKWTAQRVRQAINAWWQIVASGFGRNFVQASNAAAARNSLELGTAATATVTTSSTDTTANRLMKVGDGGLLAAVSTTITTDLNDPAPFTHLVQRGSVSSNFWPSSASGFALNFYYNERFAAQIATSLRGDRWAARGKDYTWAAWKEFAFLDSPAFTGTPSVPNLKFGNVASANVNTLDYYEKNITFTPTIYGTTTAGTVSYVAGIGGDCIRIGDDVFWTAWVAASEISGLTGDVRIGGFPFIIRSGARHRGAVTFSQVAGLSTGDAAIAGYHLDNTATLRLLKKPIGASAFSPLQGTDLTNTAQFYMSGHFRI